MIDILIRLKNAFLYKCLVHFPYSRIRVWALRKLGHYVGNKVYFPADITISQKFTENRGHLYIGDRVSFGPHVILLPIMHANNSNIRTKMQNTHSGEFA